MSKSPLRMAAFDIETTGFDGSFNRLLCVSFKFGDEDKVRTVVARTLRGEKAALEQVVKLWNQAHIVYGWNSKRFDVRFLNARLLSYGMPILSPKMHLDLYHIGKFYAKMASHSLDNMSKDLKTSQKKTPTSGEAWQLATQGDRESMDLIVKHCEQDVLVTEQMLAKFANSGLVSKVTR